MAKVIKGLLPKDEIKKITTGLFSAQFMDGGMSGGVLGDKLRATLKSPRACPTISRAFRISYGRALRRNEEFNANAFPPAHNIANF